MKCMLDVTLLVSKVNKYINTKKETNLNYVNKKIFHFFPLLNNCSFGLFIGVFISFKKKARAISDYLVYYDSHNSLYTRSNF